MEQVCLSDGIAQLELDEMTQKEYINIIKRSLKGEHLDARQVNMLFFWARHQNAPEFDFVPVKYRAVEPVQVKNKPAAKKGK